MWFDASKGLPLPLTGAAVPLLSVPVLVMAASAPLVYVSRADAAHPASLIFRICFFGALFFAVYFLPRERRTYVLTDEGLDVPAFPFKRRFIPYRDIRSVDVRVGGSGGLTLRLEADETFSPTALRVANPQDLADFIETRARTARRLSD
ncbi:MAG: hypothetical protein AB7E79_06345 [Rhodospirillaceae bacterium]